MKKNKKLLLDLYRVALVDGELTREESIVLNNFCYKNDISIDDLTKISQIDKDEKIQLPKNEEGKFVYLFEIARIIIADGVIREEEIYLFDKIAKSIKIKKDINILRKEIFRIVIEEFISNKEKQIQSLKNRLNKEYKSKIIEKVKENIISESEHEKIVKELIEGYEEGKFTHPYKEIVRIFLIGKSRENEIAIKKTIIETFIKDSINLKEKDIKLCIGDYDKIKGGFKRFKQSVTNGEFKYLIYGAHPHSLADKSGKLSWESYLKETSTIVYGDHTRDITQKSIIEAIEYFIREKQN